MINNHKIKIKN